MADSAPCGPAARCCAICEQAMVTIFDVELEMAPYSGGSTDLSTAFFLTDDLPDLSRLHCSAQKGCDFCRFLRSLIFLDETRDRLRSEYNTDIANLGCSEIKIKVDHRWFHADPANGSVNHYLIVEVDFGSDIRCDYWNSLNAVEGHDEIAKHLCLAKSLNQSYSDKGTVQWLKSCIETCEKHEHSAPKSDYLPQRLLDITDGKVRLVSRESLNVGCLGFYPHYAALSYCWGTFEDSQIQLKTTHSSLAQRQAGIQTEELLTVPALHDAIRITRKLGIPYLWIDALCILQDDISDWERNSSSMDKVYGSAKVTLVAAASRSCREGFLRVKGQQLLLPFRSLIFQSRCERLLPSHFTTQESVKGLVQLQFKFVFTGKVGAAHHSYVDFYNTPLSRRGWTIQERLLAARQIVFGPCNVHFSCAHWKQSRGARPNENRAFTMSDITTKETSELHDTWSKVVHEFMYITAESFTNPSDLLPSLSGLAHCFNRRLQDEYCAGHWKKELLTSLMWTRLNFSPISKTTHISRHLSLLPLPSWSHLCKGNLSYHNVVTQDEQDPFFRKPSQISDAPEVESLDWEKCLLRNDPMGALRSAKLNVRTRIVTLSAMNTLRVGQSHRVWSGSFSQEASEQKWEINLEDHFGSESSFLKIHLDYNCTKENLGLDAPGWKLVLLGSCAFRHLDEDSDSGLRIRNMVCGNDRYPYGLVVARLWADKEEWCRVGIFTSLDFWDPTLYIFKECSKVESITIS